MNDVEFLRWVHDRLVHIHKEEPLYDYMHRLREIIERIETMNGIHDYCELFSSPQQQGRLYLVPGSHARGQTFEIYVVKKGHTIRDQREVTNNPNTVVQVFGVVSGNPGRTESYGWLKQGPWVQDFEELCRKARQALLATTNKARKDQLEAHRREQARIDAFLKDY